MLGVYDYTVILTYISLWISIGGMMLSLNGHLDLAVLCLALSGLCDIQVLCLRSFPGSKVHFQKPVQKSSKTVFH